MKNNQLEIVRIKNRTCYLINDIFEFADFGFDNILIDEEPYKKILIYGVLQRNLIGAKPLCIRFDEIDEFIIMELDIQYFLLLNNMMTFTLELDTL